MNKEQEELYMSYLAQAIGKEADNVTREESAWHGNFYQEWMAAHPMAINVIRALLKNEEALEQTRNILAHYNENVAFRLQKEADEKFTTEEQHQELIDKLQSALEITCKVTKLFDERSSDPERMARGMLCKSLRSIISKIRASFLTSIDFDSTTVLNQNLSYDIGKPVAIRPCGKEYEGKTFFGIYLGDFPLSFGWHFDKEDSHKMIISPIYNNPAIFVPSLKHTIFGCESWWKKIESEEELKQISDSDIQNTWYVKLMQEMNKKQSSD